MSWCKIGVPSQQNAPIPLYGGVKVPLSDRCGVSPKQVKTSKEKPLVFAVMVNPNVLKRSGKMAENPQFKDGQTDVHNEGGQGLKSVTTDGLVERGDKVFREKHRFKISALSLEFSELSRSSLNSVVTEHLGSKNICAGWMPKMLTDIHKNR
ncbi:hypothetical protein J6590_095187 [Homalodisca vitripennis]|nr:hypothetical protein J6590_095187 [Homalodisca vitripennis]